MAPITKELPKDFGRMLKAEEVAEWLNVEVITIRKWTSAKKIPFVKLSGRAVRYPEHLITQWVAEKSVGIAQEAPQNSNKKGGRRKNGRRSYSDNVDFIIAHAKNEVLGK